MLNAVVTLQVLGAFSAVSLLLAAGSSAAETSPALAGLRLPFIANDGQLASRVAYYAPTFAGTVFVTREGEIVYRLRERAVGAPHGGARAASGAPWSLTEQLVGGHARPAAYERSETRVSSFIGNDSARWRAAIPAYERVSLGEVWPGVSVDLRAAGNGVEKVFTVRPGASVRRIRVRVAGAQTLTLDADGALVAGTGLGPVTFTRPVAFQERDGVRRDVAVAYRRHGREYGFTVGDYDRTLPLVIDPLLQSTYLGGGDLDKAFAIAIAPQTGDVYVAGQTISSSFPGTAGGAQPASGGGPPGTGLAADVFVARLSGGLGALLQTTYFGGGDFDQATALAIGPTGDVYVAGQTFSTNLPGVAGAAQPASGGGTDAFVARLNSGLTSLSRATYLGGSGGDVALALAIAPQTGDVYVAGYTSSTNFPRTGGAAQAANGGGTDAFVARLSGGLTELTRATYLGGGGDDFAQALSIDRATGDVYVGGFTHSGNFPGAAGGAQAFNGGISDGFVARLPATLAVLTQATYLGGEDSDSVYALAIAPGTGDVYAAGQTTSTNFPGTTGGAQPAAGGGGQDAFVARLSRSLSVLAQATYLGGSGTDVATGVTLAPQTGDVYVAGVTMSTDFPATAGGAQPAIGGGIDGFVARLTGGLTALVGATYLGGSGMDQALALAIAPTTGDVYVAGATVSTTDFPGTAGGAQPASGGYVDAFVARLSGSLAAADPALSVGVSVNQSTFAVGQVMSVALRLTNPGLPAAADFYAGMLLPDGQTLVLFTRTGTAPGRVSELASMTPIATGASLATPAEVVVPDFYSHQWTGAETRGGYRVFVAAVRAGALADGVVTADEILGIAVAPFSFP